MKTILCYFYVVILPLIILAQNKTEYDIFVPSVPKFPTLSGISEPNYLVIGNTYLDISLTEDGYFTIGTNEGLSDSQLDDNCAITFGHPFAKTSYPVFSIDDTWYKIEYYFSNPESLEVQAESNILRIDGKEPSALDLEFSMVVQDHNPSVEFIARLVNTDTIAHSIGYGLIIDPALGKWGDGILFIGQELVDHETIIMAPIPDDSLLIWEKRNGAKGLKLMLEFEGDTPEKLIAANWPDLYNSINPEYESENERSLYDLCLKLYWPEQQVKAGGVLEQRIILKLLTPDFSHKAFVRWNLPAFMSIGNGLMFPQNMKTLLELFNNSQANLDAIKLKLTIPEDLHCYNTEYTVSAAPYNYTYQNPILNANLVYEDKIGEVELDVIEDGLSIERFSRYVFLPATPVSDTGLVIINDSISTAHFPEIDLIFSAEVESSGQHILNLNKNNIFLYENNIRINEFFIDKYSGGGSTLADVVFVLDVSGSMGNEKDQVVAYLGEFSDSLAIRGYDYRIGLVTFSTEIDAVIDLTSDIDHIKQVLAAISLWGGIEDSPLALYTASILSFRPGSIRTIIWITDEPYPEHSYTKEQIVNRMLSLGIVVHGVGLTSDQTDWFNPIITPTGGNFYDINGNFRDILLAVTRLRAQDRYQITYESHTDGSDQINITLEMHYAGLGVIKNYQIQVPQGSFQGIAQLSCYPNPFNPIINLAIKKNPEYRGDLNIYNILGQRVRHYNIKAGANKKIVWDGRNEHGNMLGSGFYLVHLILRDDQNIQHRESAKILYLK